MVKVTLLDIKEESPAEAARREWFEKQVLASPDNLEAAARLLIGLVTSLLGVLFAVLAIADDPLPNYLLLPAVRGLGVTVVVLLLLCLLASLVVVVPMPEQAASGKPATQEAAFKRILRRKSWGLGVAVAAFGLGVVALGVILAIALLSAT